MRLTLLGTLAVLAVILLAGLLAVHALKPRTGQNAPDPGELP